MQNKDRIIIIWKKQKNINGQLTHRRKQIEDRRVAVSKLEVVPWVAFYWWFILLILINIHHLVGGGGGWGVYNWRRIDGDPCGQWLMALFCPLLRRLRIRKRLGILSKIIASRV